ncbi:MAG: response regulator [bacterium]|nr:response regulator [bacterium]
MARILVVDDDAQIRGVIRGMLETMGHEVHEVSDGMHATVAYREKPADLVITDIYMPDKEGLELILELRTEFPDVKIVAVSGGGGAFDLEPLETAQNLGVCATLNKPFRSEELGKLVERVLKS